MKTWLNRWATFSTRVGLCAIQNLTERSMDPWTMLHWQRPCGSMDKAFQGYWWCYFPWRFDSKFLHFSSRKPRWSHKMYVRNSEFWSELTGHPVRETLISIVVFSCLSNVRFEREWIYNSWRTFSSPSKHFDKISFWWRHWRGTSRTCRNIDEINGKRTGWCRITYTLVRSGPFKIVPTCEILSWNLS